MLFFSFKRYTYKSLSFGRQEMQVLFWFTAKKSREKIAKSGEKKIKSREKIIALLSQDNALSAAALARQIGITPKAVEKQIAKMKAEGVLKRVGPDKGGHWQVVEKTD